MKSVMKSLAGTLVILLIAGCDQSNSSDQLKVTSDKGGAQMHAPDAPSEPNPVIEGSHSPIEKQIAPAKTSPNTGPKMTVADLNGFWMTDCLPSNNYGGGSRIVKLRMENGNIELHEYDGFYNHCVDIQDTKLWPKDDFKGTFSVSGSRIDFQIERPDNALADTERSKWLNSFSLDNGDIIFTDIGHPDGTTQANQQIRFKRTGQPLRVELERKELGKYSSSITYYFDCGDHQVIEYTYNSRGENNVVVTDKPGTGQWISEDEYDKATSEYDGEDLLLKFYDGMHKDFDTLRTQVWQRSGVSTLRLRSNKMISLNGCPAISKPIEMTMEGITVHHVPVKRRVVYGLPDPDYIAGDTLVEEIVPMGVYTHVSYYRIETIGGEGYWGPLK